MSRKRLAVPGARPEVDTVGRKSRLKQSVCRWCYRGVPIEDFARECAKLGLQSVDLAPEFEWPALQKHNLLPTMIKGATTIVDGFNRIENHAGIEQRFREVVKQAAEWGAPSVIVFSGNRNGTSDGEGLDNCVLGLRKVMPAAEDAGLLVCMELLNSKLDHPGYMCDHTNWGVELVKRVGSPHFRLLYDIYHMQIMEGDVIRTIRENARYIGHLHTAGNPGRHEIDDTQELNYRAIAKAVADTGFAGYLAHEFTPTRHWLTSLREAIELCDV